MASPNMASPNMASPNMQPYGQNTGLMSTSPTPSYTTTSPSKPPHLPSSHSSARSLTTPSGLSSRSIEWDEAYDPTSAALYYINRLSGATQWEAPTAFKPLQRTPLQPLQMNMNNNMNSGMNSSKSNMNSSMSNIHAHMTVQPSPALTPPHVMQSPQHLPPPWQEFWDNESSLPYYVNAITQESSWDRPNPNTLTLNTANPPQQPSPYHPLASPSPFPTPMQSTPMQPIPGSPFMPGSSMMPGLISPMPALSSPVPSIGGLISPPVTHTPAAPLAAPPAPLTIPKTHNHWSESFDYTTNSYYFYNSATQESSWDPPAGWPHPPTLPATTPETTTYTDLRAEDVSPSEVAQAMPKYVKEYDPSSSSYFYVNAHTSQSQWDRPPSMPPTARFDSHPSARASFSARSQRKSADPLSRTPPHGATTFPTPFPQPQTGGTTPSAWESHLDEITGERFYVHTTTNESQWEEPVDFIPPKSLFEDLKNLPRPSNAAAQMHDAGPSVAPTTDYTTALQFSTAASADELAKKQARIIKKQTMVDTESAGAYKEGALTFVLRQKRAAEMLQKYIRGKRARKELRLRMKQKETWVKENSKKTGAYDDIFDRLRERGARIRVIEPWEQWLDSSGRIFYYNPYDSRGQWVPPLIFEQKMVKEEKSFHFGRERALKEDAAMRKLERNWENRTNVEDKWNKLELVQKNKLQASWHNNTWVSEASEASEASVSLSKRARHIRTPLANALASAHERTRRSHRLPRLFTPCLWQVRGYDSLITQDDYTRDALETENYRNLYTSLKKADASLDATFEKAEMDRLSRPPPTSHLSSPETEHSVDDDASLLKEAAAHAHDPQATKRFMTTVSRGTLDVNNPDMLRRAFIIRRGNLKCEHWLQLADPVHGFKFYKNTEQYTFQWEKPPGWDAEDALAAKPKSKPR